VTQPPGRLNYHFRFGPDGKESKAKPAGPLGHLLFVAPYSGTLRSENATPEFLAHVLEPGERFRITEGVLSVEPLASGGKASVYRYSDTESLHPSKLLSAVAQLSELWEPLKGLDREPEAVERLAKVLAQPPSIQAAAAASLKAADLSGNVAATPEKHEDLLERLLGQRPSGGIAPATAQQLVQRLAEQALAENRQGSASNDRGPSTHLHSPAQTELCRRLRELLRQEAFQRISGSWLATEMVVKACPDPSCARFSAVDASWELLLAEPSRLDALLKNACPSVLMVDHCFAADPSELRGLVTLAQMCHNRGVFLVTGAEYSLAGLRANDLPASDLETADLESPDLDTWQEDWAPSAREAWAQLGALREGGAQFALTLPRCMIRQPYGSRGEPLEELDFEELEDCPRPRQFLWANGAYLVARALMERWCLGQSQSDEFYDIGGLPVVTVPDGNDRRIRAPIEREFSHSAVEQLLDQGFSVVETSRDADRARIHL